MGQIFLTKHLRCTDISSENNVLDVLSKIMEGKELTIEDYQVLSSIEDHTVKEGVMTMTVCLIGPHDVESLDDLIGNMIIINEDGTFRFADDYDISILFNIPMFDGMPYEFSVGTGDYEFEVL